MGILTSRLFRFTAVLALHDTQATAESPGYSAAFSEPKITYDAAGNRIVARGEREVRVRCMVETGTFDEPTRTALGFDANTRIGLVFRASHLRAAGLLTGTECAIRFGTRLVRIERKGVIQDDYEKKDAGGRVVGGVRVQKCVPSDYGFNGERDLFVAPCEDLPSAPA